MSDIKRIVRELGANGLMGPADKLWQADTARRLASDKHALAARVLRTDATLTAAGQRNNIGASPMQGRQT